MAEANFSKGHMFVPDDMSYSDVMRHNADIASNFMETIIPYAEKACERITDGVTVIAEYCAADGKNSLTLIQKMIELIQEKRNQTEILVVYEDYTGNDYNALFRQVIKELIQEKRNQTEILVVYEDYTGNDYNALFRQVIKGIAKEGVFVTGSSTTMYKQCLPSSSVHFVFSFKGLYYPSKRPCVVTISIIPMFANAEERFMYKKQAEKDWNLFLSLRSKELKPGGLMCIIPSASTDDEIWTNLDLSLRLILKDCTISEVEYQNIHLNIYARSEEELRQPFEEKANEVEGVELVSFEMVKHTLFYVGSGSLGKERAALIAKIIRTIAYNPIVDNLSETRSKEEKDGIVDIFFNRFADIYKDYTKDLGQIYPRLIIQKKM